MKARTLALLLVLAAPGCSGAAEAPARSEDIYRLTDLPARPKGPVLDEAEILPALEEAKLEAQLRRLHEQTGDSLVVVTLSSLKGETIENYAFNIFDAWGIGDARTNRGLLLLIAPNESKLRIEVGCGLESTITNVIAGRIIREEIVPVFKGGDMIRGTQAGVDALIAQLAIPAPANDPGPVTPSCRIQAKDAA